MRGSLENTWNGLFRKRTAGANAASDAQPSAKQSDTLDHRMIRILSRQMRAPLHVAQWEIDKILNEQTGELSKKQQIVLSVIQNRNAEMIARLHDVFETLDLEHGRVSYHIAPVNVLDLWRHVLAAWRPRFFAKNIRVTLPPARRTPLLVNADAKKLRIVFDRLLSNAYHYTRHGGRIEARFTPTTSSVRFSLRDTGIGIPVREQKMVTEQFFRTEAATIMHTEGVGLGLHVAQHYLEGMHGRLGFESREGKGSAFWFTLPRSDAPRGKRKK